MVVFIAGVAGVSTSVNRLSTSFSLPGQPGYETANRVLHTYGIAADVAPYLLTITARRGQHVDAAQADAAFTAVQQAVPAARVIGHQQTGDPVFTPADGHTAFAYAFIPQPPRFTDTTLPLLEKAMAARRAGRARRRSVTGEEALANSTGGGGGPGVLAETFIGGVGALAVLLFVFASFLALLPLVIAGIAILTTFLVVLGLTYLTDISFIVEFLVALVGLGVAIDYSLLIVTRWREERARGVSQSPGRRERHGHGGTGGGVQRPDRGHRPARAGGHPGSLSPLHRGRRHAHPARLGRRGDDVAARVPRHHRSAGRLAAHPPREHRQPLLAALGTGRSCIAAGSPPASLWSSSGRCSSPS